LTAFSTTDHSHAAVSLVLVVISSILQVTTLKIDKICNDRLHEIERELGIFARERRFRTQIEGKWWFLLRRNLWCILFTILISTYLSLIFNRRLVLIVALAVGFAAILVSEAFNYVKRMARRSPESSCQH
jgi:hypothetical protein